MSNGYVKAISALGMVLFSFLPSMSAAENYFYFIEPAPVQLSRLYADGSIIELKGEIITWPMIGSDLSKITLEEFKEQVLAGRKAFENNSHKIVVSGGPTRGLNIVFNVSSPPPGAAAALESVATYIESQFADNVTVTINVGFESMGPGILGGTSNYYAGVVTWANTRTGLINGMDFNDSIQNWLPSGSTIPVRYNYTSGTATNEDRCFFSRANYNATIGTVAGNAADMTFNTDFTWDYDPSNGITGGTVCFQSVVAHEVGHVLGFVSGADFRTNDIEAMDICRFQRSDGAGDYNPDNLTEFQNTARMVDKDDAGSYSNDVNSDLISVEYQMSDGTPYQCSHFGQGQVSAIMQPAISYGQTYYPNFYKTPDKDIFDAIGWDYPATLTYTLTINTVGSGTVTKNPNLAGYLPGTPVELLANASLGWSFDHWSDSLTGSANPDTIIMNSNKTVTAHFTQNQYTLTITINGNGTVTKNPNQAYYTYGQQVILTANADPNWLFDHWSGGLTGSQNPDTLIIDGNESVTAYFVNNQCTLIVNINGNGVVIKNPDQTYYTYGQEVELFAIADSNWLFDHWSGGLTGNQNPDTIVIEQDTTVNAHFAEEPYAEEDQTVRIGQGSIEIFPNPANNNVTIKYSFAQGCSKMVLMIYTTAGALIKSISLPVAYSSMPATISWDGCDNTGKKVASGIYFLKFLAPDCTTTRKILVLR